MISVVRVSPIICVTYVMRVTSVLFVVLKQALCVRVGSVIPAIALRSPAALMYRLLAATVLRPTAAARLFALYALHGGGRASYAFPGEAGGRTRS